MLASGTMRAGLVAGNDLVDEHALADRVATSLNVEPAVTEGSTEDLVRRLNDGEIDIVIGDFAQATPWSDRAAMTGPARAIDPPADQPVLRALVRSGENRWLIDLSRILKESAA